MSRGIKTLIGLLITVAISAFLGWSTSLFLDPGIIRSLLSFVIGVIVGIVGWDLTEDWVNASEGEI